MTVSRRALLLGLTCLLAIVAPLSSSPAPQVTEISLERTACYGTCPVYELVLRSDGTATFHGGAHSRLEGEWTGKFPAKDFSELVLLAEHIGYFSFHDVYEQPVTDSPWTNSSIVRGGKRKTVKNYAETGPLALAGFEAAIDLLATRVEWSKAK